MRIAFLLPRIELAGGIFIVLEHARRLVEAHGHDVAIVTTEDQIVSHAFPSLSELTHVGLEEAAGEEFDLAIATWWQTVYALPRLVAPRYAQFIQNLEDRFYPPSEAAVRGGAASVQTLPLAYITTAGWLERQLRALRPDAAVYCIRSGIDKSVFHAERGAQAYEGPLRIVVEGQSDVWFKGVPDALDAVRRMQEQRHLTVLTGDRTPTREILALADRVEGRLSHPQVAEVFREADVLLKLSRLEGMAGPPLEAFHCGATAVLTPMTGYDEYGRHGHNCMIVGYDDPWGTARALDLLARDRALLTRLRTNALETADAWHTWEQASEELAAVVADIAGKPPAADARLVRLLIEQTYANHLRELAVVPADAPGLVARVRWVWRHEGPRGIVIKVARRSRLARRALLASRGADEARETAPGTPIEE